MEDVETRIRQEHPLATTPTFAVMDLEYADDTAPIARTAEIAGKPLQYTEEEAAKYGLSLNRKKTVRMAYNTEENGESRRRDPSPKSQKRTLPRHNHQ